MDKGRSTSSGGPKEASELIIREIMDSVRRIVSLDRFMIPVQCSSRNLENDTLLSSLH